MKFLRFALNLVLFAAGVAILGVLVWIGYKVGMWIAGK